MFSSLALYDAIHEILGSRGYKIRGDEYIYFCVFHDDQRTPNLYVNYSKNCYYCFACGAGGNLQSLARHLGLIFPDRNILSVREKVRALWSKATLPDEKTLKKVATSRALQVDTLLLAEARVLQSDDEDSKEFQNYLVFPIRTRSGALQSLVGYALSPSLVKYKHVKGAEVSAFLLDKLPPPTSPSAEKIPVYVVEGVFDALSVVEWRAAALSTLGLSRYKTLFQSRIIPNKGYTYIIAPDFDAAGQESLYKIAITAFLNDFMDAFVLFPTVENFPLKDFNDIHKQGKTADSFVNAGLLACEPIPAYLADEMLKRGEPPLCVLLFFAFTATDSAFSFIPSSLLRRLHGELEHIIGSLTLGFSPNNETVLLWNEHKEDFVVLLIASTTMAGRSVIAKYFLPYEIHRLFSHIPILSFSYSDIPIFDKDDVERAARNIAFRTRRIYQNGLLSLAQFLKTVLPFK